VAVYLLFLVCRALRPGAEGTQTGKQALGNWRVAGLLLSWSSLSVLLVALAFYVPFWAGQSLHAIASSFSSNPAADYGENSLMRSVVNWLPLHPELRHTPVWQFLSQRRVWDMLNYLAVALCLLLGARQFWRTPTVQALLTLMLAMMCVVLLLTPWFFTWYITWIVGLAVVCLPALSRRGTRAFFALALTFSYSALTLYLFNQNLLGPNGYLVSFFDILPPLGACLLCWWLFPRQRQRHAGATAA